MADCVFCKILAGEIPRTSCMRMRQFWHSETYSRRPQSIFWSSPKTHIAGASEITEQNSQTVAHIEVIPRLAAQEGMTDYRIVTNNGEQAGQTVHHLHFHVLGGRTGGALY